MRRALLLAACCAAALPVTACKSKKGCEEVIAAIREQRAEVARHQGSSNQSVTAKIAAYRKASDVVEKLAGLGDVEVMAFDYKSLASSASTAFISANASRSSSIFKEHYDKALEAESKVNLKADEILSFCQ